MAMKKQFVQQYANTYVETAVSEATPHKLVEMLYDGALKNMNLAKVFMLQKDFEKKSIYINKALSILASLRTCVDLEKGGDIAKNLYDLYDYCYRRLFESSLKNDTEIVDEIISHIRTVSEAWKMMPDNIKKVSKEQIDKIKV